VQSSDSFSSAPGSNASRAKKKPVTADTALRLGKFFKTGAAFWMHIQARFDLETAEDVLAPQIKKIASYEAA
jgi:plasmid maintenance system antidote protein VapI